MAQPAAEKTILNMIRKLRAKVDPKVLERAQKIAEMQMAAMTGAELGPNGPPTDNTASMLFKRAKANGGKQRKEILDLLERWHEKRDDSKSRH